MEEKNEYFLPFAAAKFSLRLFSGKILFNAKRPEPRRRLPTEKDLPEAVRSWFNRQLPLWTFRPFGQVGPVSNRPEHPSLFQDRRYCLPGRVDDPVEFVLSDAKRRCEAQDVALWHGAANDPLRQQR